MADDLLFESFDLSQYFFGSYSHSIDSKSRIIIPNAYREQLGDIVALTIDPIDKAIDIYPEEGFKKMVFELLQKKSSDPALAKKRWHVAKFSSHGLTVDSQGRITLPTELREYVLKDSKDIVISGAFDHLVIMDSAESANIDEDYRRHSEEIESEIAQLEE